MSISAKCKDAWQNRDKLGDQHHDRELAQFLPAALEIQATPPHPLARWLTWSLVALTLLGITWAAVGKVNIVASAEGKIIPSSRVKHIQPLEKAVVKAILVKEGQYVQQGDALIALDNTLTRADQTRLSTELDTLQRNLTVSQSLLDLLSKPVTEQQHITYAKLTLANSEQGSTLYKQLLWQQWQQYWSQTQTLQHSLTRTQAEQAASREQIIKLPRQQNLWVIFGSGRPPIV
ncbi:MAG: biotin/lipoyl-binding protein [Pseudomonadota bacterium]